MSSNSAAFHFFSWACCPIPNTLSSGCGIQRHSMAQCRVFHSCAVKSQCQSREAIIIMTGMCLTQFPSYIHNSRPFFNLHLTTAQAEREGWPSTLGSARSRTPNCLPVSKLKQRCPKLNYCLTPQATRQSFDRSCHPTQGLCACSAGR